MLTQLNILFYYYIILSLLEISPISPLLICSVITVNSHQEARHLLGCILAMSLALSDPFNSMPDVIHLHVHVGRGCSR
jgi:hypothetical protein